MSWIWCLDLMCLLADCLAMSSRECNEASQDSGCVGPASRASLAGRFSCCPQKVVELAVKLP